MPRARGHALIDRELYLPEPWIADRERCRRAGIPDGTEFETKPRQAMAMLARAFAAGVPFAWITADEAYGQVKYLRAWLEDHDAAYVLATKVNDTLTTTDGAEAPGGRADRAACPPGRGGGCRSGPVRTGHASTTGRGSRSGSAGGPGAGTGCSPAARSRNRPRSPTTSATDPAARRLLDLAWIAGTRWRIEECFQQAKNEAGLDHYQVRSWRAWYAHITLSMLAHAWLAVSRSLAIKGESVSASQA